MKKTSVIIFPGTVPAVQVLLPLVLVFGPVVYCQPVENDDSGETVGTLCAALVDRALCSLHAPAPLGENRERFLHLVRDLRQRQDDYAAQLSYVSLAAISTGSSPAFESKSSIVSSLLSGHGIDSGAGQGLREKLLWQARLVLKLGEQYDADRLKLSQDMENIRRREQSMFGGLKQETGNPFSLTEKLSSSLADTNGMQRLRLKAWARLYAFGPASVPGARFFVSADPDAVERLCEEYERSSGSRPSAFLTVSLPARYPDENRFFDQFQRFRKDEAAVVENLSSTFENPSIIIGDEQDAWNAAIDRCFPQQDCGRCRLVLYTFSKVRVKQLFLDSFGHDEDDLEAEQAGEADQDIVIGLLAEQCLVPG